jgi:predicted Zn-ribbon and HTH transcriptional regulator
MRQRGKDVEVQATNQTILTLSILQRNAVFSSSMVAPGYLNMEHRLTEENNFTISIVVALALAMLVVTAGCASPDRRQAPSLEDIVRMSEQGESDEEIIGLLIESRAVYPLSSAKIVDLHQRGVTTEVLDHMQKAYVEHERRLERWMYSDPYWGRSCVTCGYHRHGWGPPIYGYPFYYP